METKDKITIIISLLALVVSVAGFIYTRYQEWRTARGAIIKAFQGEKEAVAYVAYQVRNKRWKSRFKSRNKFRNDVITALCLAWSLERSDRAKALVFDSLKNLVKQNYIKDISRIVLDIYGQYKKYQNTFHPKGFEERIVEMEKLMKEFAITFHPDSPEYSGSK